jgi:hypothetical protein
MNMLNIGALAETVQDNCHISDARYAGNYSLCIFLLKMREYYRWEHDIPLSRQLPRDDVGSWIQEREQIWDDFESLAYQPLSLPGGEIDPFEAEAINKHLIPQGYVYSSGYGLFNKPHFYLAKLRQKLEHDGMTVLVSDCEYARDLVAPPAMLLGNTIFIRRESLRRMIWEKVEAWQWKKDENAALARALDCYESTDDMDIVLDRLCDNETQNVILHELGEAQAGKLLGGEWEEMLARLTRSRTEMQVRAVRDHLSDCLSTLPALLSSDDRASLHFYFANFIGMRKEIFPGLFSAYQGWSETQNPQHLHSIVEHGQQHWLNVGNRILALFRDVHDQSLQQNDNDFSERVEALLQAPI